MTPEKWRKIEPILNGALELNAEQRAAFLAEMCADDADLLHEIETLIASYDEAGEFIENPVIAKSSSSDFAEKRVGAYLLKKEIGRGGMGAVYLATRADGEFRQKVAVKLIKRGMDTDFILRRFRNERQILAALNHPNIAYLLDGGTTEDDLPYFVMEYIEGNSVTEYCERMNLPLEEKLQLFLQICSAVSHAHQKKVIHRDIKPTNVLVTAAGVPKLLDFGIAKVLDPEMAHGTYDPTTLALRLMTPEYASPEQARGETVTVASDQYSLGVLLYKMLTGALPYKINTKAPHEIVRIICESKPLPPSEAGLKNESNTFNFHLLDSIVLKTLKKNPAERYASVQEFADDIESFLKNRPVKVQTILKRETDLNSSGSLQKPLAVLPFKMLGAANDENSADNFLGVGLADALIVRLSKISRLTLCPTSAVLHYVNNNIESLAAARELGAGFVVEGTIRRAANRVRVSAQLLNVSEGTTRWAESFDENLTDVLELEDLISTKIAEALIPHLTTEERRKLEQRGTNKPDAYEAYLRGRAIWHSYTEQGLAEAKEYFQRAVEIDPNFAAAHSGIADFYIGIGIVSVIPPAEAFKLAKVSAQRAIELDPNLAEAYASLAFCIWAYDWNSEESERIFRKCFELNDRYAQGHEWFAHVLASQGRFDEAINQMHRALEIDPQSSQLNAITAYTYHNARRHREGARFIERAVQLDPNNYIALQGFGWMYPPLGKSREAIPYCRKAVEISNRAPICVWILAQVYAGLGETGETCKLLDQLLEISAVRYVSPYYIGMLYTSLGEFDEAFRQLEKAIDNRDYWAQWLPVEYRFDPIRSDSRFSKLLKRLKSEKPTSVSSADYNDQTQETSAEQKKTAAQKKNDKEIGEITSQKADGFTDFFKRRWSVIFTLAAVALVLLFGGGYIFEMLRQSSAAFHPQPANSNLKNLTNNVANDIFPRLSPDGKRVVFVSNRDNASEIYTINVDGSDLRRLTNNEEIELVPAWTPDGKQIVFDRADEDRLESDIWIMNAENGANQTNLTNSKAYDSRAAVSPDGTQIAFASNSVDSLKNPSAKPIFNIFLMNIDGTNQRRLTEYPFTETEPAWSPDGSRIAFTRTMENGKSEIFVMNADGTNLANLTNTPDTSEALPAWSPDGKFIAYTSDQNLPRGRTDIWLMNSDGGNPHVITDHKSLNAQPSWTPDGRVIIFDSGRDGNDEIYLINISSDSH